MKLCQIVPSLEERHGGPSRSVHALAATLAQAGHDVELLSTESGPAREQLEGRLRVRNFPRDWPLRLGRSTGLRAALRADDSDIIHHHSVWLRTVHYAHCAARRKNTPFVISPRGMFSAWAWHHRGWRKKLARTFIHPGAFTDVAGWHATSAEEGKEIQALGFRQPVCVAPNGIEQPSFTELAQAGSYWNSVCPTVGQRPVALFYSRFHQKKRVLELIDLWLEHGPRDWLLLMVGIPQDYTPKELEAYVMRASGAGRVLAYDGADQLPPYAVASLFLLPSHNENFGLVIAEAMAHGAPVIVTDTTPWSEVNTDGRGWCVRWEDYPSALRAATAEGPHRLRERGSRAQAWVVREFSSEKSAQTLSAFYAKLKGGHA